MRMILVAAVISILTGCSSVKYGNFADGTTPFTNKKLADETVAQLVSIYPPASTRFNLGQETTDAYGSTLLAGLRAKGYSLLEYTPTRVEPTAPPKQNTYAVPATRNLLLRYIVDRAGDNDLYRVSIIVGSQTISRAYVAYNNNVYPAGAWARKE